MTLFFIILAIISISILAYLKIFSPKVKTKENQPTEKIVESKQTAQQNLPNNSFNELEDLDEENKIQPPSPMASPPDFPEI